MAKWSPRNASDALLSETSSSLFADHNHSHYASTDVKDLHAVFRAVHTIRARWRLFATALGMAFDIIDAVRRNCSDVDGCLQEILWHWLKRNYDTEEHGHPSWRRLCVAVADPAGGENKALAEEIATQHPTTEVSKSG